MGAADILLRAQRRVNVVPCQFDCDSLHLDLAVSIASPTPCLGRINVLDPGPTLVYLAEDSGPLGSGRGAVTKSRVKAQLVPFPLDAPRTGLAD